MDIGIAYDPTSAKDKLKETELDASDLGPIWLLAPNTDFYPPIVESLEADLQKLLGREIVTSFEPWTSFYNIIRSDSADPLIYVLQSFMNYADAQSMWEIWDLGSSFSGEAKDEFLDLLQEGASTVSTSERQKSYASAEDIIVNQETVIVPLVADSQLWLVNPKLMGEFLPLFPHMENWAFVK